MIFFGIDPGSTITGYGVVKAISNTISWVDSGVIIPKSTDKLPDKLVFIYDSLCEKLASHKPDCVCIEEAFYAKNVHTTLILGHARGVAMLAAAKVSACILEFAPREIKKAITGNGNADKSQVEYMVKMLLSPPVAHSKSDAYDALAVALCGFYHGIPAGLKT